MCVNRFIIEQDLKRLGITDFYIEEQVAQNITDIPLKSNEILYINYFNVAVRSPHFSVKLQSADNSHKYDEKNTKIANGSKFSYDSCLFLKFTTSVKVVATSAVAITNYFFQAYLITINTHKTQCHDKNE